MTIFKQIALNGSLLKEVPFQREFELQGCLMAHPELLSLAEGNDDFNVKDLIGVERKLKHGRVDMLVEYGSGKVAIIELKKREIDERDYQQLCGYLNDVAKVKGWNALQDYMKRNADFEEQICERNMFGVLVGRSFSSKVMDMLKKTGKRRPVINGLIIKRYMSGDNEYFATEVISNFCMKDYQKYLVDGEGPFGKGRMVLAAIKALVAKRVWRKLSYNDLTSDDKLPSSLRGTKGKWGCVSLLAEARPLEEQTGRRRHFLNEEDVIVLGSGEKIVVSSQWGIGNINNFIKRVGKFGIDVKKVKATR